MPNTEDPRTGRIVYRDEWGYRTPVKAIGVLCGDGKRRTVTVRDADTWFSMPGSVRAYGKSISGYVSFANYVDTATGETISVLTFRPYLYGKNADILPAPPEDYSDLSL